jgi:DNA-binding transcriptional MocR family regulator
VSVKSVHGIEKKIVYNRPVKFNIKLALAFPPISSYLQIISEQKGRNSMILINLDSQIRTPLFRQIFDQIAQNIEKGDLKPGDRLPSTRMMAERLSVHRSTVNRAYEELWGYGYLESRPGSYSTIRRKQKLAGLNQAEKPKEYEWDKKLSASAGRILNFFRDPAFSGERSSHSGIIDFCPLDLDARVIPAEDFRKSVNRVLLKDGPALLRYGAPQGHPVLREVIARRLRIHGISTSAENILVTNGAQNGFELIIKMLISPGDRVIVESPTYSLALPQLVYYGARIKGVEMTESGIDLKQLEKALTRGRTAMIYTIPNFHNPTGITTTQSHREQLLALCEKYQVPLVEDGFEEEMKYFGKVALPIKSMDRHQIVLYLGTFSKVLFPGIRIGWIAGGATAIEKLTALKRFSDLSTNNPIQAALSDFCMNGSYDRHVLRMHRIFRKRMQAAKDAMRKYAAHRDVAWTESSGGYLIWIKFSKLGNSWDRVEESFFRNRVKVQKGHIFFPEKVRDRYIRLSISTLNELEIEEGIKRLGKTIHEIYQ